MEDSDEQTAIEVEFVDPTIRRAKEHAAAKRKNALLAALARKAKADLNYPNYNNNNNLKTKSQRDPVFMRWPQQQQQQMNHSMLISQPMRNENF